MIMPSTSTWNVEGALFQNRRVTIHCSEKRTHSRISRIAQNLTHLPGVFAIILLSQVEFQLIQWYRLNSILRLQTCIQLKPSTENVNSRLFLKWWIKYGGNEMFLTVSQKFFSYVGKGCVTIMRKAQGTSSELESAYFQRNFLLTNLSWK